MKRNRILALLLAGCMVLGNSNVLLYAEEADEQLFTIEEDEESEIQEDVMEEQADEEEALYASDLIEDEEEELYAAETADTTPPEIDGSTLMLVMPEGKEVLTVNESATMSVRIIDESDITSASIYYQEKVTKKIQIVGLQRKEGTEDTWEGSFNVGEQTASGVWEIFQLYARDVNGNEGLLHNSAVLSNEPNADLSRYNITVTGTNADTMPPEIDGSTLMLVMPEGKEVLTVNESATMSVRIIDESDITSASIYYQEKVTKKIQIVGLQRKEGTEDTWEGSFDVGEQTASGVWEIFQLYARDVNGNEGLLHNSAVLSNEPNADLSHYNITVTEMFKITFDSRGGSEVETQYVLPGDKAVKPEKPTKDEYEFGGWYADEELKVPFDFETPINENTTIYAKWDELPDITVTIGVYDQTNEVCGQGGTYTFNDEDGIHTADKHIVKKGSEVTIAAAPADGYKFVEWVEGEVIEGTEELQIRPTGELGDPESTDTFYAEQDVVLCAVFADENILSGWCGDNVRYELNKNTGLLTISGTGPMTEYAGTDLISPFSDNQEIKKIIVEDGVTTISKRAFESCMKVTEVTLPDSVTEIGEQAFSNCIELQRITLPRNITSIKEETFVYCIALQEVSIPENVTVIGIEAFSHCVKLSELVIPANVTSIDGYAFAGCMDLTSVVVDPGNPVYDSRNNCNAIIDTASDTLLFGCSGTVIPDTVKAIGEGAFIGPLFYYMFYEDEYGELPNNLKLTQIEIPGSVTEIGDWAFAYNIGLVNVSLPEGLQRIGEGAFEECIALQSIVIPDSVTEMGSNAFNWCTALQSVSLPTGISEIKNGTFYGCSALEEIQIPGGVKRIGDQAFNGCSSLSSVTIPDGFETFGEYVFDGCTSLMEIDLPASLTELKRISLDGSGILTKSGAIHYAGSRQQWKKITNGSETMIPQTYGAYDITFEPNGGSAVDPQIVSAGGTVQKPEDPAKDEDVFGGWFTDEALTEPFDFDEVIHADVTLYAKWLSPDTDFDLGNCSVTFDESYRVLDQIESTPYDGWFYVVPSGTVLEPIVKSGDETLTSNYYKASYSECMFYEERNEWDKIDDNAWIDHFPTDAGVYFCKVEGVDPYTGKYEYIDLIRILPGVTFDTRGGSEVATQHMYPGETAAVPEKPTKEGSSFEGWYTEETLTDAFDFSTPISENITLYAKWYCDLSICSYDKTNQADRAGGQFLIEEAWWMDKEEYGGCNCTLLEGNITLKAFPDPRYAFKGWYKGEYIGGDAQISRPLDMDDPENLLSKDLKYTFNLDKGMIICPVFEICTDHDFGPDQTVKATTTAEGRVYHVCKNCGTEVTIKVLPKLKSAAPAEKITVSKKPSIQKPAATKSKITVKWKHFKHTSKKTKKIWKKIKKVQVQCATDKTFKNIVKDVKIGRGKTKYAIKGLARKTTYYVRVRYYDGVGYSAWSKVKKAKTK